MTTPNIKNFYCPDIYKSIFLRSIGENRIELGFCCQSRVDRIDLDNLNSALSEKRQRWQESSGKSDCMNCINLESRGLTSRRHASMEYFSNLGEKLDEHTDLINLEWNCDNVCNLACLTCGPVFSSRWMQEINSYSWKDRRKHRILNKSTFVIDNLDIKNLRRVYFNGGEPLLTDDHKRIMDKLRSNGRLSQCEISYNTNCTIFPDAQTLDFWREAKLVRLFLSLDAIGEAFEFIRWPARWHLVEKFLEFIKSQDFNIILDITCTVGIHNVFYLHTLRKWQKDNLPCNHQGDPVSLNLQPCGDMSWGGKSLSLTNVSQMVRDDIEHYCKEHDFGDVRAWLSTESNSNDDSTWIKYLDEISNVRGVDWKKSLVYLAERCRI